MAKQKFTLRKRAVQRFCRSIHTACHPLRLECTANHRIVVEGCLRILMYDENCIRLQTTEGTVGFEGNSLHINCMAGGSALVCGNIVAVFFEEDAECG